MYYLSDSPPLTIGQGVRCLASAETCPVDRNAFVAHFDFLGDLIMDYSKNFIDLPNAAEFDNGYLDGDDISHLEEESYNHRMLAEAQAIMAGESMMLITKEHMRCVLLILEDLSNNT